METKFDAARNPDSFLQIGDLVGASFFITSMTLFAISIFILFRLRYIPSIWKEPVLIASLVPLIASINSFYRRSYWISTLTDPVEFRFFDWFLTVPLMAICFYYLLKPLGAKKRMFIMLLAGSIIMLGGGYIGESVFPESPVSWGILGTLGLCLIIGNIMAYGYPKIFQLGVDPALRKGYLFLSVLLPLGWSIYPFGYLSSPGNIMEGFLQMDTISLMYNFADVFNKGGLAIGIYLIATTYSGPQDKDFQSLKQSVLAGSENGKHVAPSIPSAHPEFPIK